MFSKLLNYYHLFQIVFLMKNRKSKKRTQDPSPYSNRNHPLPLSRFNIKFDLTKSNLQCFIGQKRQNKKTLPKRSHSNQIKKQTETKNSLLPLN